MADAPINFYEFVARRKLATGADWRLHRTEDAGPVGTLVIGGVPRVIKSGFDKGKVSWRNVRLLSCLVTPGELLRAKRAYEQRTGKCSECQGDGCECCGGDFARKELGG